MLWPDDANLVRRDWALPGLELLLDPEALAAALQRALPRIALGAVQARYVRYKPAVSCLVGYQLEVAGAVVDAYGKTYRRENLDKFRAIAAEARAPGALGPGHLLWEDRAVVLCAYPNDRELRSLRLLGSAAERESLLREVVPDRPDLWRATTVPLAYKPERRCTVQLVATEARAVLKLYAEPGYHAAHSGAGMPRAGATLRVARQIGRCEPRRAAVFEWLAGEPLHEAMQHARFDVEVMTTVGAALAQLHAQTPDGLPELAREAQCRALLGVGEGIASTCPPLAESAKELARRLAALLSDQPPCAATVHGDFHARQVLLTAGGGVGIIDLDRMARGDPAADLGNFAAHLEREALRGGLPATRAFALIDRLWRGYEKSAGQIMAGRADLYAAVGLFKLAHEPFRCREPEWTRRTGEILERVDQVLRRTPGGKAGGTVGGTARPTAPPPDASNVAVSDPLGAAGDPKMTLLAGALDPARIERSLAGLPCWPDTRDPRVRLLAVRVIRYKPGRRCLIEYEVALHPAGTAPQIMTLVGKVRGKGLDKTSLRTQQALWNAGFGPDAADGVCVPEPLGAIPELQMWLQRKVPGVPLSRLLGGPEGVSLAARTADAIYRLHQANVPTQRRHTLEDELRILRERLEWVALDRPRLAPRLARILEAANRLRAAVREPEPCGIHRDFYPEQVLVGGPRLWLVDFDTYCAGDPALDAGNFLAHITEQSLREHGDPLALADRERALEDRFAALAGDQTRPRMRSYATLSLARHIQISAQRAERRPFTEALIDLCEQRLGRCPAAQCS